jgi:ATP-dependent Clp protease ATP-binding subunit ClpA
MAAKEDARKWVFKAAHAEARRRGDRRLGSEHLLLGVLHDPDNVAAQALGVDLAAAHKALEELDREALAAIGLDVSGLRLTGRLPTGRRQQLSSSAQEVLLRAVKISGRRMQRPTSRVLLLALLGCERPDPAAELLARLGIDRAEVRARLEQSDDR